MKKVCLSLVFLVATLASASAYAEDQLLFEQNYLLKNNVVYQTGLYKVFSGPVKTNKIYLAQSGSPLCDIRVFKVEYTTKLIDFVRSAAPVANAGAVYDIPEGKIYGINIHFFQEKWNNVDCTLRAFVGEGPDIDPDPPGPGSDEELVGAIEYQGGFDDSATLPLDGSQDVKSFRVAIPSFCDGVEVLEAGTVRNGTYYPATELGNGHFSVGLLAGKHPSAITLALNGPNSSSCDIPIFVRFE